MIETTVQASHLCIRGNYWGCVLELGQDMPLSHQRASDWALAALKKYYFSSQLDGNI